MANSPLLEDCRAAGRLALNIVTYGSMAVCFALGTYLWLSGEEVPIAALVGMAAIVIISMSSVLLFGFRVERSVQKADQAGGVRKT
jgi:hypothetical protein